MGHDTLVRRKASRQLMGDIRDALQRAAECSIRPKAYTVAINETNRPLELSIVIQTEVGVWESYILTLTRKRA